MLRAMEENSKFSRMAEEKLQMKMEQNEENRMAYLTALMERLQERVSIRATAMILDGQDQDFDTKKKKTKLLTPNVNSQRTNLTNTTDGG